MCDFSCTVASESALSFSLALTFPDVSFLFASFPFPLPSWRSAGSEREGEGALRSPFGAGEGPLPASLSLTAGMGGVGGEMKPIALRDTRRWEKNDFGHCAWETLKLPRRTQLQTSESGGGAE